MEFIYYRPFYVRDSLSTILYHHSNLSPVKNIVAWDVTSCSPVEIRGCFGPPCVLVAWITIGREDGYSSSETSVKFCRITRRHNDRCKNLKPVTSTSSSVKIPRPGPAVIDRKFLIYITFNYPTFLSTNFYQLFSCHKRIRKVTCNAPCGHFPLAISDMTFSNTCLYTSQNPSFTSEQACVIIQPHEK
jgi:hypothetical protein